ncbi:hypothetical protein [Peterkaempfera bronchialis]|uniref:hypothetical protein n=1 Tax=Peterkaempfera bronchialis TaxID=2126346 RepID=UPI003C2DB54E
MAGQHALRHRGGGAGRVGCRGDGGWNGVIEGRDGGWQVGRAQASDQEQSGCLRLVDDDELLAIGADEDGGFGDAVALEGGMGVEVPDGPCQLLLLGGVGQVSGL